MSTVVKLNAVGLMAAIAAILTAIQPVSAFPPQTISVPPELVHLFDPLSRTPCPGSSEDTCDEGQTCCKLFTEGFGCCPMENAVCCTDGQHCCPHDTTCDLIHLTCVRQTENELFMADLTPFAKTESKTSETNILEAEIDNNINVEFLEGFFFCPDKNFQCKEGQSCCETTDGWGCCPTEAAVCCGDGVHCCPQGSTCDVTTSTCIWPQIARILQTPLLNKEPARRTNHFNPPQENEMSCPDVTFSCKKSETCCQLTEGWGCCPVKDAICCQDELTCCPFGSICNETSSTCDWTSEAYVEGPMLAAFLIMKTSDDPIEIFNDSSKCSDPEFSCQEGQTCCPTTDQKFGCCPMDNAVCCSDGVHCCPSGSKCDLEKQACLHENIFGQILYQSLSSTREPAEESLYDDEQSLNDIICPDKQFRCDDGQTCCALEDGGYGCCPMPDAVCCEDKIHCCPRDTTCDVQSGACVSTMGLPWLNQKWTEPEKLQMTLKEKEELERGAPIIPNFPMTLNGTSQDCGAGHLECDDHSCCPNSNTCCQLLTGDTGCCSIANAECCLDGRTCCFPGMRCTNTGHEPNCEF